MQDKPIHILCQVTSPEHSANRSTYSIIFDSSSNLSKYHPSFYTCSQLPHDIPDLFTSTHSANREGTGNSSSTGAWRTPWQEEPGGLEFMGSLRVGHDWATSLSLFTFMHCRRKWQPTPVFLPGESQGWGNLMGCHLWGHTESNTTEASSSSSILPKLSLKIKYIFIPS